MANLWKYIPFFGSDEENELKDVQKIDVNDPAAAKRAIDDGMVTVSGIIVH